MDEHLNKGCIQEAEKRKQEKMKKRCNHEKCKKIELVPMQCRYCQKTYCLK